MYICIYIYIYIHRIIYMRCCYETAVIAMDVDETCAKVIVFSVRSPRERRERFFVFLSSCGESVFL